MPRNSDRVDPGSSQLNLTPSSPEFRRASFVSPEGEAQTFEGGRDPFCRRIYAASRAACTRYPTVLDSKPSLSTNSALAPLPFLVPSNQPACLRNHSKVPFP